MVWSLAKDTSIQWCLAVSGMRYFNDCQTDQQNTDKSPAKFKCHHEANRWIDWNDSYEVIFLNKPVLLMILLFIDDSHPRECLIINPHLIKFVLQFQNKIPRVIINIFLSFINKDLILWLSFLPYIAISTCKLINN